MRGYGESDRPKSRRAYDLSELTSDVSEVIKALGHKECAPLHPYVNCTYFCTAFVSCV